MENDNIQLQFNTQKTMNTVMSHALIIDTPKILFWRGPDKEPEPGRDEPTNVFF